MNNNSIHKTPIVWNQAYTYQVMFGGVVLVDERGNGMFEALYYLPQDVTQEIQETWHDYNYYLDQNGAISRTFVNG